MTGRTLKRLEILLRSPRSFDDYRPNESVMEDKELTGVIHEFLDGAYAIVRKHSKDMGEEYFSETRALLEEMGLDGTALRERLDAEERAYSGCAVKPGPVFSSDVLFLHKVSGYEGV